MLLSAPLEVARTNAVTSAPIPTSASVRCEPMNPSAPVTTTVRPPYTSPNSRRKSARALSVQIGSALIRNTLARVAKPSARSPRSTLSSGLLTALSLAVVTGLSAAVGIVIAREFGRDAVTDGFFSAYAVFLVLVLAASAVRVAVLPALARARVEGTFGSVLGSYALALGIVAVPALANSIVALGIPLTAIALRADWGRRVPLEVRSRFVDLARAATLPIVLQAFFVVCLRFASGLGTGAVTSFTYAYFVASALVAVTASSLGLVSSVPLSRSALSDERASRHVVSTALVSFAAVAAAAGVFALVGEPIIRAALGPGREGRVPCVRPRRDRRPRLARLRRPGLAPARLGGGPDRHRCLRCAARRPAGSGSAAGLGLPANARLDCRPCCATS